MYIIIQLLFLFSSIYPSTSTYTITVEVINIPSNQGHVIISLHNDSNTFPKKYFIRKTTLIKNGIAEISFKDLKKGKYALTAIHDINGNGKMDFNIFHIPNEKTCASNGAKGFIGPPKFKDAVFKLNSDLKVSLSF